MSFDVGEAILRGQSQHHLQAAVATPTHHLAATDAPSHSEAPTPVCLTRLYVLHRQNQQLRVLEVEQLVKFGRNMPEMHRRVEIRSDITDKCRDVHGYTKEVPS
jgi:hypothetical protein